MEGETEISLISFLTQTQSMNVITTKCIFTLAHSNLDDGNKHYTSQVGCRVQGCCKANALQQSSILGDMYYSCTHTALSPKLTLINWICTGRWAVIFL